jgi:DNA-binding transcriptional ArsR family regulator
MPPEELEAALRYLKALADESRLRLLGLLATRERSVEELAALLRLRAPTVSHHLARLKALDLVSMRAEGNTHYYRLNGKGLGRINRLLATPEHVVALAQDQQGDAWERKVLRDFLEDGRLKTIPAQEKKRLVILSWLAEHFAWGRVYTEKEVNELLRQVHPDTASLRRYLVGYHFLEREHGEYWRVQREAPDEATLVALAEHFTPGQRYSEAEVNALLGRVAPDHAASVLRRDLLASNRLYTRRGQYWRPMPDELVWEE